MKRTMQKPLYSVLPPNKLATGYQPPVISNAYGCLIFSRSENGEIHVTVHNTLTARLKPDEALALAAWIICQANNKPAPATAP